MTDLANTWKTLPDNKRKAVIVLIFVAIAAIGYFVYTQLQPSGSGGTLQGLRELCLQDCAGAQQAGTQPFTFCSTWVQIDNTTYTCTNIGLSCTVNGYTYNQGTCT